jgi:dihydrodipicolinate synthase/N-acetylneuraminate lyase
MLHGTIAAALTPLGGGGALPDESAVEPYVDYLASHGVDGILALGTTGEGMLFDLEERRRIAELFIDAGRDRLQVAVHCGAQTTADTVELAEHAAMYGASAVAVIAPPYFALDADELLTHFEEAARACSPAPFYVYEFAARSGHAVPLGVLSDVFVGPEALIPQGFARGAVGAVSGLAGSFPDAVVALTGDPTPEAGERVGALRASLQALPFHAASKTAVALRGVPMRPGVRRPLRGLRDDERDAVERIVRDWAG